MSGAAAESYLDWRPVALDGPIVEGARRQLDMMFAMRLSAASAWPSAEEAVLAD